MSRSQMPTPIDYVTVLWDNAAYEPAKSQPLVRPAP